MARSVDDPFSITKTFIGTAILQLADQGRLSTTDKLSKWYPDFPNADLITVDDLLRMQSGIADSADTAFLAEYYASLLAALSADDMIRRAAANASRFTPPGQVTVYTNINFILLEQIAVKVTGRDIGAQLQESILGPLGMNATFYPAGSSLTGRLHGYSRDPTSGAFVDRTALNPAPARSARTPPISSPMPGRCAPGGCSSRRPSRRACRPTIWKARPTSSAMAKAS